MQPFIPENDLDRAIRAIGRSQSAMPEFYRAQAAKGKKWEVELSLADETNETEVARLFQQAKPFFVAADYQPPAPEE